MGFPMGPVTPTGDGGYWQKFQSGYIIGKPGTGYWESKGAIRGRWTTLGYQSGTLGYPTGPEAYAGNNAYYQTYQKGTIFWSKATGAWESYGPVRDRWIALGSQTGVMGFPMGAVYPTGDGGYWQKFQSGYIIGKPGTGYWESKGGIRKHWTKLGYQTGSMGYPTSGELYDSSLKAYYQLYEHGKIFYQSSPAKAWVEQ